MILGGRDQTEVSPVAPEEADPPTPSMPKPRSAPPTD